MPTRQSSYYFHQCSCSSPMTWWKRGQLDKCHLSRRFMFVKDQGPLADLEVEWLYRGSWCVAFTCHDKMPRRAHELVDWFRCSRVFSSGLKVTPQKMEQIAILPLGKTLGSLLCSFAMRCLLVLKSLQGTCSRQRQTQQPSGARSAQLTRARSEFWLNA